MLSVAAQVDPAHVVPVEQDLPFACHVKTDDHVQYGGLPGTGLPDKGDRLPLLDAQVQVIEHPVPTVVVAKADIPEFKDTVHIRQRILALIVLHVLRQQNLTDRVHRLDTLGDDRQQCHDRGDLVDHRGKITLIERDIAHLDAPLHRKIPGKRQTDHLEDLKDRPADRSKQRLHHIELIPFLCHGKELAADLLHFLVL